jgi:phytanoyl-CoA hydroxylase
MTFDSRRVTNFEIASQDSSVLIDIAIKGYINSIIKDGFVIIKPTQDYVYLCDQARQDFYRFLEKNQDLVEPHKDDYGTLSRIVNLHTIVPSLFSLFSNAKNALDVLDFFLGETVVYTSLYFERGSNQEIHRDTPYFSTNPENLYMGMWIALEDVDQSNGPLEVIPGGHKLPKPNLNEIITKNYPQGGDVDPYSMGLWCDYQAAIHAQCALAKLKKQQAWMQKGDIIIWHANTPHGGAKTIDNSRTRNSIVYHVTPKDTPVGHQKEFYGINKLALSGSTSFDYVEILRRKYMRQDTINFAHQMSVPLEKIIT